MSDDAETFADDGHRYRLDSRIATGGMGEVWRSTDTTLGREVAVKLLKHEYADDAAFRSRFETEARHAASLHHPGVAAVYDFGEAATTDGSESQRPYLVMELVDGQPLSALIRPGEPMAPDVVRDLLAQAAEALGAAHAAGIVHRDVKPANLMVTPEREVKITDFGIARAADGLGLTETGQVMGTPQYLSPEQAAGSAATPASDVYSLGCVAFECLAGARPFVRDSPIATALAHLRDDVPELPASVPADLAAVVRRALAKKPEERFPDAAAFAAALRDPANVAPLAAAAAAGAAGVAGAAGADTGDSTQVLTGLGPVGAAAAGAGAAAAGTEPATPAGRRADTGRRRSVPWLVVGAIVLILVAVVAVIALAKGGGDSSTPPTTPHHTRSKGPSSPPPTTQASQATQPSQPTQSATSQAPSSSPTSSAPTTSAPAPTTSAASPTSPTGAPTSSAPATTTSSSPAAASPSAAATPDSTSSPSAAPSAAASRSTTEGKAPR
ncbi:MAG: serine/threonine-protein kinase [Nocardioides sp.]